MPATHPTKAEEPAPRLRRLTITRDGGNAVLLRCWCAKSRRLELVNINVFCRAVNDFLEEHSWCQVPGQEQSA